jgi:hypothetical protein
VSEWPALRSLAGSFLNEDWPELYGDDPMAAVDAFAKAQRMSAPKLSAEVANLLRALPGEAELALFMEDLNLGYDPVADGLSYREWLRSVADRVRARPSAP